MDRRKTVAVIGCGALGSIVAGNLERKLGSAYRLTGVLARNITHAKALAEHASCKACQDIEDLLEDRPDYVVELAGVSAVLEYGEAVLRSGSDFVIVSIGALADHATKDRLTRAAEDSGTHIYVVSGAIGGLDVMQTMAIMGVCKASIDNIKPCGSLNGAPYLKGIPLPEDQETLVFDGPVEDAIRGFPKNVNVAVATALASDCPNTRVTIQSSPDAARNCHQICLQNEQAEIHMTFSSKPDPDNPKSSSITAWSVLALLKQLASPIRFF